MTTAAASSVTLAVSHLFLAAGASTAWSRSASVSGQDVAACAWHRGEVVDGADLRDPLAVPLFALGKPVLQLRARSRPRAWRSPGGARRGASRCPCRRRRARPGRSGRSGRAPAGRRTLDVDQRPRRARLLDLPLPEPLPGRPLDRVEPVFERAARRLDRRQPPQPVRVLLRGQVQQPVGGIQVPVPAAHGRRAARPAPRRTPSASGRP